MSLLIAAKQHPISDWQLTSVGAVSHIAVIVVLLVSVLLIIWTWRSFEPTIKLKTRLLIISLRSAVLLTAIAILMQPTLSVRRLKSLPSEAAILIDTSGSMSRGDDSSRLSEVARILGKDSDKLKELAHRHKLKYYSFSDNLNVANSLDEALKPDTKSRGTEIISALESLGNRDASTPLSGVLLLSDGVDTTAQKTFDADTIKALADKLNAPVNTVAITLADQRKDLSIKATKADSFAFSRTQTVINVEARSTGFDQSNVELTLWQAGSVVGRKTVELIGGNGHTTFSMVPIRLGTQVLTVTAPVFEDDEIPSNNTSHLSFDVFRDKFRVLHVSGRPSWDQRFLRDALTSWPKLDIVSFYILRTVYQSSTQSSSGLALIPFPTQDLFENHLNEFDVIIFQDFDPIAVGVDAYLKKITSFVKDGGGLIVIGGPDGYGSGAIIKPPFSDILPVDLLPADAPSDHLVDSSPFRAKLTKAGMRHPIMKILKDPQSNTKLWKSAERLNGIVRVANKTEGAVTLAEHPFVKVDDGAAPLITVREIDKGRTIAITTDSTWRWRFEGPMKGGSSELYGEFWKRAILWLTKDPALNRLSINIVTDKITEESPVVVEYSLVDESYEPRPSAELTCMLSWFDSAGAEQSEPREIRLDDDGKFKMEWKPKDTGPHVITATTKDGLKSTKHFLVNTVGGELQNLDADPSLLEKIAIATGGTHSVDTLELDRLSLASTPDMETLSRKDIPFWNHPITLIFLLLLLTGEWLLRRRAGLS